MAAQDIPEFQSLIADRMLARILDGSSASFERLVVKLVTAMGYGGSIADAGRALG